ncbi:MAG: hypothetical protein Q7R65_04985 [bacterium]|nr:hypothetical protein [bacterium]
MLGFKEIIYNYMEKATQSEFEKLPKKETEDNGITDISAVAGELTSAREAANADKYAVESLEKRTALSSVKEPAAHQWLENIHSYDDYRLILSFYRKGFISFIENEPVFNLEKIKGKTWREIIPRKSSEEPLSFSRSADGLYDCLQKNGVVGLPDRGVFAKSNEHERKDKGSRFLREEITLPDSLGMLISGERGSAAYGGGKREQGWYNPIVLPDGTTTNALEVRIAQRMQELGVKKTQSGLVFTKGEFTGERATLSKMTGSSTSGGLPQDKSSLEVYSRYLPNLRKAGLVQESDFHVNERGKELNNIRLKRKTSADVSLRSSLGASKYYFGRDKYIQNSKPIPEETFTATIDGRTGGIFEEQNGVKKLKYIFPLLTADEYEAEKIKIATKFGKAVSELTESEIIQNARKKLSPHEIKEYSALNYISQYNGESSNDYLKRIESTFNVEETINVINDIFMAADLDHLQLSWGKKIRLTEAVKRIEKEKIISFAKKFGVTGLQVLLASEVENDWPEEVMAFSGNPGMGDLFKAFAPLLTDEDEFRNLIDISIFENEDARKYLADLRRATLRDVITEIRKVASGEVPLADVITRSREGVLAKLSLVKALKKEGLLDSLENIKGVEFASFSSEQLTEIEKETMRTIYSQNYANMPKLRGSLLKSFDQAMTDTSGKQRFYIFKHEGVVKGFCRLEETTPRHLYFSAFNIDPSYKGYRLGEAVFSQSLDYEAELANIEADCDRQAPISCFYIENGFIGTDTYDFEEAKALHIIRNDELRSLLFGSTDYSHDNIKRIAKIGTIVEEKGGKIKIAAFPASEIESIPFPQQTQVESDGSRYVLTRYFREETNTGEIVYAVLEKISGEDFKRFVERANPYPPGMKTRFEERGDYHIV